MDRPDTTVLQNLGYRSYRDYLASGHWRSVKARYYRKCVRQCYGCGATDRLDLHHRTYARLGREKVGDLICVCRTCHETIHALASCGASTISAAAHGIRIMHFKAGTFSGEPRMKSRRHAGVTISFRR